MGLVNLTCDGWQASNTDGYFAVTAHWIESKKAASMEWQLRSALIGFVRLNTAHDGRNLAHALFGVTERLDITTKVLPFTLYSVCLLLFLFK